MTIEKKKQLFLTIGISGSGKSSSRRRDCYVICKDDIRFMLLNFFRTRKDFDPDIEKIVQRTVNYLFLQLLDNHYNIYIDETNLTPEKRRYYIDHAREYGYQINLLVFANHKKAEQNNNKRKRKVPANIIETQKQLFTFPTKEETSIAESIKIIK